MLWIERTDRVNHNVGVPSLIRLAAHKTVRSLQSVFGSARHQRTAVGALFFPSLVYVCCPLEHTGTYGLFRHSGIARRLRMRKSLCGPRHSYERNTTISVETRR